MEIGIKTIVGRISSDVRNEVVALSCDLLKSYHENQSVEIENIEEIENNLEIRIFFAMISTWAYEKYQTEDQLMDAIQYIISFVDHSQGNNEECLFISRYRDSIIKYTVACYILYRNRKKQ